MVPWTFSLPGDLNSDARFAASSFTVVLGSNRKAVVRRRRGSSTASSSWEFAAVLQLLRSFGWAFAVRLALGVVSDSLF